MTGWFESNRRFLNQREAAFSFLRENLPKAPVIVETGSLRCVGSVAGDGNATLLFDELTADAGMVYSIDVDEQCGENISKHCGKQVLFIKGDSVRALADLSALVKNIDLLYLDSLDVDFDFDDVAARHALHEVQAALSLLGRRAFVAVDDNDVLGAGKGRLVTEFAKLKGWSLVVDGYIKIWSCSNGNR